MILGAGISGISAAFHTQQKYPNTEVVIYKKSELGGLCSGFHIDSNEGKFWFDNAVHLSFAKYYVQKIFQESSEPILHTPNPIDYFQEF